jgi:hypothetical protein
LAFSFAVDGVEGVKDARHPDLLCRSGLEDLGEFGEANGRSLSEIDLAIREVFEARVALGMEKLSFLNVRKQNGGFPEILVKGAF